MKEGLLPVHPLYKGATPPLPGNDMVPGQKNYGVEIMLQRKVIVRVAAWF